MPLQSRRFFLKTTFLSSFIMVGLQGKLFAVVTPLQTLAIVQEDLFPRKMINQSNAYQYISLVFQHSRISAEKKQFLRNGSKWLNEEAVELFSQVYTKLPHQKRELVLQSIAKQHWGESWIKMVLSFIMEATLGDPIYGINKNESGWRWLEHEAGLPRPRESYL